MVYSNKLVAVVKCNGHLLRDNKTIVSLPFGSEYSLLIKNLSMQKVVVGVNIDGSDVLNNNRIAINASENHELFGFMDRFGKVTNKFKFIEKTEKIVDYRGDKIDDGFINIDFQFEQQYVAPVITYYPPIYNNSYTYYPPVYGAMSGNESVYGACSVSASCVQERNLNSDEGITVKGSQIDQQYKNTYIANLEPEKHNIIIRLQGISNSNIPITTPIYTDTKLICVTCGRKCKSNMKFCPECGTSLL
jgi:hypothetical protein